MSSEEQPATNRLDIMEQQRKRQARINEALDWRSSKDNHPEDFDSTFKLIRDKAKDSIKSASSSLPTELEPITYQKSIELGLSPEEWKRQDSVRSIKRNQYLSSRRLSQ